MEKFEGLSHLFVTFFLFIYAHFMVVPAITDVTMSALCPGEDECSLAIYLTGFQQAITGLGTLVMMPLIGILSDEYGRKALLTLPMILSIFPPVILGYSRTKTFFYAYYVLKTLTAMVCEGSVHCLALAYVADNTSDSQRGSAFGILSGVGSAAFVCGTLTARFLSTPTTFQAAAFVAVLAAVYMRAFLSESVSDGDASPLLVPKRSPDIIRSSVDSSKKTQLFKRIPSVEDILCLLNSSLTFSQAAIVAFFNSFGEGSIHASLMYYLKARFHFNKDQFSELMLISGVAGTISQLLLMPILTPVIGEEKLLSIGLFVSCTNMFLYSISWSFWVSIIATKLACFFASFNCLTIFCPCFGNSLCVPYVVSVFSVFVVFAPPCLRSIASKQVGPNEQGKAQGCISGICSFANIVSPLAFTPLTALFLSEGAPFHFPGFSIMCIGFVSVRTFTI
ncbi:hypothetical protein HHK36_002891 [Tetracentron sinense]|uniref:Major facilitator superfamily (MFS) profile domain-containing protein n=1 Tax=Tetracentron sinense TaxID=13715 RepID=A0A834ZSC6_TETSI|nr:hypothetical protein HHK36_002891 [Tetracentron sinense]